MTFTAQLSAVYAQNQSLLCVGLGAWAAEGTGV